MAVVSSSFITHRFIFATISLIVVSDPSVSASDAGASPANYTIRIGYFMSTDPLRAAALNLGIDRAQDEGILSRHNFRSVMLVFGFAKGALQTRECGQQCNFFCFSLHGVLGHLKSLGLLGAARYSLSWGRAALYRVCQFFIRRMYMHCCSFFSRPSTV